MKKYLAELVGTFTLVLMGCGAAIFLGCGAPAEKLAVAFAFGLSVVAMAYCIGGISGCHINPAITVGVWLSKRMSGKDAICYIVAQIIGAICASAVLYALVNCGAGAVHAASTTTGANVCNGTVGQGFLAEFVFTFIFVLVVLGATDSEKGAGNFAGLAIGLTLVLVHIVCIPITGTSVNPARSIGPAIFAAIEGNVTPISQIWIFILAPLAGAALSALVWKCLACKCCKEK